MTGTALLHTASNTPQRGRRAWSETRRRRRHGGGGGQQGGEKKKPARTCPNQKSEKCVDARMPGQGPSARGSEAPRHAAHEHGAIMYAGGRLMNGRGAARKGVRRLTQERTEQERLSRWEGTECIRVARRSWLWGKGRRLQVERSGSSLLTVGVPGFHAWRSWTACAVSAVKCASRASFIVLHERPKGARWPGVSLRWVGRGPQLCDI